MSQIIATIEKIECVESLNIVIFLSYGSRLKMVSLELDSKVVLGKEVVLSCKPASVALAKPIMENEKMHSILSYANQIKSVILSIDKGKLLSSVKVGFKDAVLESLIITDSLEKMKIKEGDEVIALIKGSDLSILEIKDD